MALPQDDLEWVDWLTRRHDAELPSLEMLDRYYEGTQPLRYMEPEVQRQVGARIRPVVVAWPQLIVDSVEERLDVEGFRLPDEDSADDDMWRVWQANDLDETSQLGHVDALVMRRSYVCVGSREGDADTPLVTVESPLEVYADIDPRDRTVRAALRRVDEGDGVVTEHAQYATLYLPEATIWYRWAGGWKEIDRDRHGLGVVPVVPLINRSRLRATRRRSDTGMAVQYGVSEMAPVLPLSDAACKLATDMMVGAEFHSLPLRAMFGASPEDFQDAEGKQLTAMEVVMGKMLAVPTADGGEIKPYEFGASSLTNFHDSINQLAKLVASIAGLPPHYLGYATDNPASADAIRSSEARLVKRAERKQRAFGGGWEQVMRLVRRFQSGTWDPTLVRLETDWRDASTPTVAESADAAVKLFTAGIVPRRQTRETIGYSDVQIKRMEEEDAKAAEMEPLAVASRALGQQQPAEPAAGAA